MVLAAVAAMVGCSKENTPMNVVEKGNVTVNASILLDATRVSVEGENFTDVKWSEGDKIQLSSVAGTSMVMTTSEISESRDQAFFAGDGELVSAVDTYYAIYPVATIADGVAKVNLAEQSGNDAAVLVAKANSTTAEGINMAFTPANALLHVAVSGVDTLAKAEFKSFDGSAIASEFVYDFVAETASAEGETSAYVVENPAVDGFFFSLPADMDMAAGYVVSLTDVEGNVCTKAYNGKTFAKGTTTRVNIEWSTPSVALGTPMTSYSYYVSGDVNKANSCANNVIYFTTASTFAGVQNAMIAEAGYIVNGEYIAVATDASSKSISGNVTVSSWGEKSVQAYIKTKDGKEYKSADTATVHITGLPYTYNFVNGSLDAYRNAGWSTNGKLRVSNESLAGRDKTLVLNHRRYSKVFIVLFNEHEKGFVVSPKFNVPASVMVQPAIAHSSYNAGGYLERTTYVGAVSSTTSSNTSSVSFKTTAGNSTSGTVQGKGEWKSAFELSASNPYISVDCNDTTGDNLGAYYFLHEVAFRYAE